jgi:hypothetical protein
MGHLPFRSRVMLKLSSVFNFNRNSHYIDNNSQNSSKYLLSFIVL